MFTFDSYKAFCRDYDKMLTERDWAARGRQLLAPDFKRRLYIEMPAEYRANLPTYTLAVCPLCGGEVREAIDTFSLAGIGWQTDEPLGFGWYGRLLYDESYLAPSSHTEVSYQSACGCTRAVTYGVYLHGCLPTDVSVPQVMIGSPTPFVLRPFMEQEGAFAVIRTLPIGGLDDETWRPRYTAYFVSYFHKNPAIYTQAHAPQEPSSPDFVWNPDLFDYDLAQWVAKGKLFWLDEQLRLRQNMLDIWESLRGRWRIKYKRLQLLPPHIPVQKTLYGGNGGAWQRAEAAQIEALAQYPHV